MNATQEDTIVLQKTRDLCQTIVEQPDFQVMRGRIEAFLGDEPARNQYQLVMEKGEALQHKQQNGMPLDNQEITDFETNREQLLGNPLARDFLAAQQEMQKIQDAVIQYLGKTFELGRVPTSEELSSGSCGSGCGCH